MSFVSSILLVGPIGFIIGVVINTYFHVDIIIAIVILFIYYASIFGLALYGIHRDNMNMRELDKDERDSLR